MTLDEYRKSGFEVVAMYGTVAVPHGAKGWKLDTVLYDAKRKFIRHFEKQGWAMVYAPSAHRVKAWEDTFRAIPAKEGRGLIYVPTSAGMREDNPLFQPGKDQYELAAWFARPPQQIFLDIPDAQWLRVKDKLPFLKVAD